VKKDFLSLLDIDSDELDELFALTDELKLSNHYKPLDGKIVSLIFQKPSLRTRVSFEIGIHQLGGFPVFLPQESIGIGTRESAADVARLLSRYGQLIIARLFDHSVLVELAHHASVPVVNALTDRSHPCQVLADLYTLRQHGKLHPGVKVVFVGDGNNVVNSWLEMAALYPMHFVLAAPHGYGPDAGILQYAQSVGMSRIEIIEDPMEAVRGADVIYTDVWTSMGQEKEAAIRRNAFAGYQVNFRLLESAKPDCVVMHCLPAHRGEEVTADVLDGEHSIVFDQAENRLHVQKALLARLADHWAMTQPSLPHHERMAIPLFSQ
jgi:ornithine carbamoyltransferase